MTSTIIDPVAQSLADILAALGVSPSVTAHKWEPSATGTLPSGVVELPQFRRRAADRAESQVGTRDWKLIYPVVIYVDYTDAVAAQAQVAEIAEAFAIAVDADETLGATVLDAKVIEADPSYDL